MTTQAYLPRGYCWDGRALQCALEIRRDVNEFMHAHPRMRVFSALRRMDRGGDHRCGFAIDIVPVEFSDRESAFAAYRDAVHLWELGRVAYVEPFSETWLPGNHHVHISFRRCPVSWRARLLELIRSGGRR